MDRGETKVRYWLDIAMAGWFGTAFGSLSAHPASVKTAWCGARPEHVAECGARPEHVAECCTRQTRC
jgi:hypothetical protein